MRYIAWDLETNDLLRGLTCVHMITISDLETGKVYGYTDNDTTGAKHPADGSIADGLEVIQKSEVNVTFNGWGFDILVLEQLYPDWSYDGLHFDLMTHGETIFTMDEIKMMDVRLMKQGKLPKFLFSRTSLKAWAYRAGGEQKDEYKGGWGEFNLSMWDYGLQDAVTTHDVYHWMMKRPVSWMEAWIEQEIARLIGRQARNGWNFDTKKAAVLLGECSQDMGDVEREMIKVFGSWYRIDKARAKHKLYQGNKGGYRHWPIGDAPRKVAMLNNQWRVQVPKGTRTLKAGCGGKPTTYTQDAPFTPVEYHHFSPGSRADIYHGLNSKYAWEPTERTPTGGPKISADTLADVEGPEGAAALKYLQYQQLLGYLTSWLKAEKGGRIYGRVNTNRANTRRMTHDGPNVAQVPGKGKLKGSECRELFTADDGWVQLGADASGLELRCLANRLAPYDGGAYGEVLLTGDVHLLHCSAATGIPMGDIKELQRKYGKNLTYAFLYGAGNGKLLQTYRTIPDAPKVKSGAVIRGRIETGITGLGEMIEDLVCKLQDNDHILALDGGKLKSRSEHSLLNLQLQSDGALIMKVALIKFDEICQDQGLNEGTDFKLVGNIHDEIQVTCPDANAEVIGQALQAGMVAAGEHFKLAIPIEGTYSIGKSWKDTH